MLESIKKAKIGSIVPVFEEQESLDSTEFFGKLSNNGTKAHSLLFEYEDFTIGTSQPALMAVGKGDSFEITALSESGKKCLSLLRKGLSFCDKVKVSKDVLSGIVPKQNRNASHEQRFKSKSHLDVLKSIAFAFKHIQESFTEYAGLYGMLNHTFVHSLEGLDSEELKEQSVDYILYFVDNGFVVDHKNESSFFVAYALVTDSKTDKLMHDVKTRLKFYSRVIDKKPAKVKKVAKKKQSVSYDTSDEELAGIVKDLKRHIVNGQIVQISPSRLVTSNLNANVLHLYEQVRKSGNNYSFFMNTPHGVFMGAQPSLGINVYGEKQKSVSFTTVTTTRPRGVVNSEIDSDLDSKRAIRIWADDQEMVKHLISLDASRNVMSEVCQAGSIQVKNMFAMKRQEHFQYLLSKVTGALKQGFDATHALRAVHCFSSGYPKLQSLRILSTLEKSPREFFGGTVLMLNADGNLRAMQLEPITVQKDTVSFRSSSSIIHNGLDANDLQKGHSEEETMLELIRAAGGLK